jgi:hypothetical protein
MAPATESVERKALDYRTAPCRGAVLLRQVKPLSAFCNETNFTRLRE